MIINSDHQRALKGSNAFQEEDKRLIIVRKMRVVNKSIISIDKDRSVCAILELLHRQYEGIFDLAFANDGDQNSQVIQSVRLVSVWALSSLMALCTKSSLRAGF